MKVLWMCNRLLSRVYELQGKIKNIPSTGGWLEGLSDSLLKSKDVDLICVFLLSDITKMEYRKKDNFSYYLIPATQKEIMSGDTSAVSYRELLKKVIVDENPQVIHLFGTELKASWIATQICKELGIVEKVVVSIQGLVSVYSEHYFDGFDTGWKNICTIQELKNATNMRKDQRGYFLRGKLEIDTLQNVKNVIGRTDWDKGIVNLINPHVRYHFCNETLRREFYTDEWSYRSCKPHSIYISQASYPIKGFHMFLQALQYVVKRYPDTIVNVAGNNRFGSNIVKGSGYYLYLQHLMKLYNVEKNVNFLGAIDAASVKKKLLESNVYVSPSNIENSPNSLGEAMLLGVPCITSDVGGVKNLIDHGTEGYVYPYNEYYMLAYYVIQVFDMQEDVEKISYNARKHAKTTHNPDANQQTLMDIYHEIEGQEEQ